MSATAENTVEITCRRCKNKWQAQSIVLPMLKNPVVPSICAECDQDLQDEAKARARSEQVARQTERTEQRAAQWQKLCPIEYRLTTESGGKTVLARLELECKQLPRILAWKFGERGLVIRSRQSGRCKTRAAWRLLRKHWNEGRTISAFTAGAFQRHAQDEAGKFTITAWFNKLIAADIVFLDDLGKGYWTENTEALWFDLVEHRTSQGKPVIVTTNHTGDELIKGSRSEATAYAIRRLRDYCEGVALD